MTDADAPFHAQGLFTGLTQEESEEILAAGSPLSFPAEEAVFRSGDHGDAMYVITHGEVKVEVGGRFHVLRPGDFFGEMALIDAAPRSASVFASTEVQYLAISRWDFHRQLRRDPDIALRIMATLAQRLRSREEEWA
jgi:CRP/FNR family transcriptional regulator, cyclic AMP receptor protein